MLVTILISALFIHKGGGDMKGDFLIYFILRWVVYISLIKKNLNHVTDFFFDILWTTQNQISKSTRS